MAAEKSSCPVPAEESELEGMIKIAIHHAASSLGFNLKIQQEESIFYFVKGMDVFVSLPTFSSTE